MSLMQDSEFLAALAGLEAKDPKSKKRHPDRFDARAVLVPLGTALLDGDAEAEAVVTRVRGLVESGRPAWEAAVAEELTLAATEHVRSCDPAWLKHPRYDFPYTVAARHRLEARLRAVEALGLAVEERLLDQIERADRILAPFLASRASGEHGAHDSRP
jgi:hypothetical protein